MSDDPIQFLSPAIARHLDGDISRSTEIRRVRNGVWPPPVYDDNGRKSYVASEFYKCLRKRAESRDMPAVARGVSDPNAAAAKAARAGVKIGAPKLKSLYPRPSNRGDSEPGQSDPKKQMAKAEHAGQPAPERKKITREVLPSPG